MQLYEKIKSEGIYFIAEMSANHAGCLKNALDIVSAAKEAGADCIKIQTYTADTMTINCDNEYFRIKGGLWDNYNLYKLYQEAYTPWEWQSEIKAQADKIGIDFLSTPFDKTSVDFLENLGIEAYKIASFELTDLPLIDHVASKGKPIIMSCGMATINEIEEAVLTAKKRGNDKIILLKCCSEYPASFSDMNLSVISDMQKRFELPVGLSDHSMGSLASIVASSFGACVIEKHFCLSRAIKNPDSEFSMEPDEFKAMVTDVKNAIKIKGEPGYTLTEKEKKNLVFRRSIFAVKDIKKGEKFTKENIRCIRPSYGVKPKYYNEILNKEAAGEIKFGEPINWFMVSGNLKNAKFESSRLIYNGITENDSDDIVKWRSDFENAKFFINSEPLNMQTHLSWFKSYKINNERYDFTISCKNSEEPKKIGVVSIGEINYIEGSASLGYLIGEKDYRGRGYTIEAVNQLIKICFEILFLKKIYIVSRIDNPASIAIAVKTGFIKCAEKSFVKSGYAFDCYELIKK